MKIELQYGGSVETVEVPDRNLIGVLHPNDAGPFQDTNLELRKAAEACAAASQGCGRVLVLLNDYTRPTPNAAILDVLESVLIGKELRFLVCLGTHRPPTDPELHRLFGTDRYERFRDRIFCHNCQDNAGLFFAGRTRFGTDVWFNRTLAWPDIIVSINSVEPHYFAGYTGGRKSFVPGVAGLDTICQNHDMVTREGSVTFGLVGNPVHEDMEEAARMLLRPVFSIQVVLDRCHRLCSVYFGDLFASFNAAVRDCFRVYAVPVKEPADIVLSVLQPPYDINFYQAQRAVEFARPVLKKPSVHITVSRCRDGVGNDGFIRVFQLHKTPADVLRTGAAGSESRTAEGGCLLGRHKAARLAQIMESTELYTVMGVDDAVVQSTFMKPFHSVQAALDTALEHIGLDARVYVVPDAGAVVPVPTA